MELTTLDVRNVYGKVLFILPEREIQTDSISTADKTEAEGKKVIETIPTPVTIQATPPKVEKDPQPLIQWRTKPNSKITLILLEAEYRDKTLTELLKNIIASLKINFELVSFGIIKGGSEHNLRIEDFEDLPTTLGIVFFPFTTTPTLDRAIYTVPTLTEMTAQIEKKREAWNILKPLVPHIV